MNRVNVLDFDDHVLERIINYISKRQNLALTCKRFYAAICRVEKYEMKLLIESATLEDCYESIMNSRRQFNEFQLDAKALSSDNVYVISSLKLFGDNITKANVNYLTSKDSLSFLKHLIKLEHLEMLFTKTDAEYQKDDETENFFRIKNLHVNSRDGVPDIFHLFTHGVLDNVIIEIKNFNKDLDKFWATQPNIKKLKGNFISLRQMECLKLEEFISTNCNIDVSEVVNFLKSQPNLIKLELEACVKESQLQIFPNLLLENLNNLQILNICFEELSFELMISLTKLKNLKELSLQIFEDDFDVSVLTSVVFSNLRKLFLEISETSITREFLNKLKSSFPCLKVLSLRTDMPLILYELLNIFCEIETVAIDLWDQLAIGDFFHPNVDKNYKNLTELHFTFSGKRFPISCMNNLINKNFLPNLQIIKFDGLSQITFNEEFHLWIKNLPKVQLLIIKNIKIEDEDFDISEKLNKIKNLDITFNCTCDHIEGIRNFLDEQFDGIKCKNFTIKK
ncbi:CLUMA_CG003035, isoform A [Clunio marinus]|uniref:CLUMA_CG003035, isoform A n=1 Tax=Clunio marinus TaxID=568069 RepID=A0A1J1HPG0_9DIPT|nr:CLUMA_CG003035, isoform A [Clunio marinus]